jgi:hypothetical protein
MPSFAELKKNRSTQFDKLNSQLQKLAGAKGGSDDKIWKPTTDKAGVGYAVIRFLPAPANEEYPFVKVLDHGFQGPGGWYIEKSLRTLDLPDPCGEYNSKLWNSGIEANKDLARKQKLRKNFYANIYVVQDKGNPSNEGKVFLYKFGPKIMEKLKEAMNPQFETDVRVNPFDLWEGADFRLKIRQGDGGWPNYDKSEFAPPASMVGPNGEKLSDDEMEEICNQCHSLQALLDPSTFKTYEELQARLNRALGVTSTETVPSDDEDSIDFSTPTKIKETAPAKLKESPPALEDEDDDDDASMEYFKKLAQSID